MFEILENYDKTREWPIGKLRIGIMPNKITILKLKKLKKKQASRYQELLKKL